MSRGELGLFSWRKEIWVGKERVDDRTSVFGSTPLRSGPRCRALDGRRSWSARPCPRVPSGRVAYFNRQLLAQGSKCGFDVVQPGVVVQVEQSVDVGAGDPQSARQLGLAD